PEPKDGELLPLPEPLFPVASAETLAPVSTVRLLLIVSVMNGLCEESSTEEFELTLSEFRERLKSTRTLALPITLTAGPLTSRTVLLPARPALSATKLPKLLELALV